MITLPITVLQWRKLSRLMAEGMASMLALVLWRYLKYLQCRVRFSLERNHLKEKSWHAYTNATFRCYGPRLDFDSNMPTTRREENMGKW